MPAAPDPIPGFLQRVPDAAPAVLQAFDDLEMRLSEAVLARHPGTSEGRAAMIRDAAFCAEVRALRVRYARGASAGGR